MSETFKIPFKTFNEASEEFLKTSLKIYDARKRESYGKSCLAKFIQAFNAKDKSLFIKYFYNFYKLSPEHKKFFESQFFINENGKFFSQDAFLKNNNYLDGPGFKGEDVLKFISEKADGIVIETKYCKGRVIYVSSDNSKYNFMCIPLTEIYLESISLFKTDVPSNKILALKFLVTFFCTIYHTLPDIAPEKEKILKNVMEINENYKNYLVDFAITESESKNTGDGLNFVTDSIDKFLKSSNLKGKEPFDIGKLIETGKSLMSDENINTAGTLVGDLAKDIDMKGNPASIIKGIRNLLTSDKVGDLIDNFFPSEPTNTSSGSSNGNGTKPGSEPPMSVPIGISEAAGDQD